MKLATEKEKERFRKWYKGNREHHLNNVKQRQKRNNYSSEKTEKQRIIRSIKRKTRRLYPLKSKTCEICKIKKVTEHHHTTIPIEFDKFKLVCHDCHPDEDYKLDNRNKLLNLNRTGG